MEKDRIPELELTLRVININMEVNHQILEQCNILREYSRFVEIARKCQRANPESGLQDAVKQCVREGILREYLVRKGSEVINMLTAEYRCEDDIAENRDEAYTNGYSDGEKDGRTETLIKLVQDGMLSAENGAKYSEMNLADFRDLLHRAETMDEGN